MSMFAQLDPNDCGVEAVSPLVRSARLQLPVNITASAFSSNGEYLALARGDGGISTVSGVSSLEFQDAGRAQTVETEFALSTLDVHKVAATKVLPLGDSFVTGGQDGCVMLLPADGAHGGRVVWQSSEDWIEALSVYPAKNLIAVAAGKKVAILDASGSLLGESVFAKMVSGLAFDADGLRLAVSHYDGATILTAPELGDPTELSWRGWHLDVIWSPCGRYIVTSTQEKELHVWDLVTMQDYRIGGYQRKILQMAWSSNGESMICSGADVMTSWSFAGAGPNGRPPVEIGFVFGGTVTAVAANPARPLVAGGFNTGSVLVGATGKGEAVIAQSRTGEPIGWLSWSPCGRRLAASGIRGQLSVFALADDLKIA